MTLYLVIAGNVNCAVTNIRLAPDQQPRPHTPARLSCPHSSLQRCTSHLRHSPVSPALQNVLQTLQWPTIPPVTVILSPDSPINKPFLTLSSYAECLQTLQWPTISPVYDCDGRRGDSDDVHDSSCIVRKSEMGMAPEIVQLWRDQSQFLPTPSQVSNGALYFFWTIWYLHKLLRCSLHNAW